MMKFLLGTTITTVMMLGAAQAADLKAPAYKAPPAPYYYNWNGCYIGAHAGGGWGDKDWTFLPPNGAAGLDAGSHSVSGALAGGQIGCDIQSGQWVFGAEFQGSWANIDGSHAGNAVDPATIVSHSEIDSILTLTGRLGFANNNWLFYAKGGGAWAREHFFVTNAGASTIFDVNQTRTGWTVGAGIEWGFAPNWSAKVEYNFIDFGTKTAFVGTTAPTDIDQTIHTVKVGINYRFWGGRY
jgi:outer membrane immunogenic protein